MVQGRKESHEVCYSPNLAATDWPLKQLLLLHGGSLVDPRLSRYSFFHCPSTTLPELPIPIPPLRGISHLQETAAIHTARKILEIQITVSQMRLRREGHTSLTRKTSTIWSETLVLPSPMLSFWHPVSSSGTCWMKVCKSQIR